MFTGNGATKGTSAIGERWGLSHDAVVQLVNQTIADNSKIQPGSKVGNGCC